MTLSVSVREHCADSDWTFLIAPSQRRSSWSSGSLGLSAAGAGGWAVPAAPVSSSTGRVRTRRRIASPEGFAGRTGRRPAGGRLIAAGGAREKGGRRAARRFLLVGPGGT